MKSTQEIGKLEIEIMELIGKLPKSINLLIEPGITSLGVNLSKVEENLQNYSKNEIKNALINLRNLGYIVELNGPTNLHCIALKPNIIRQYGINYNYG